MDHASDGTEAWVAIPSETERRAQMPPGVPASGYDYGFLPAMGRLLSAHKEIGPAFGNLFRTVMFDPGHLSRQEREMVAAVAAAAQDCHY
ncbi:MAG: carboxymuconolactone decarboxylase family protein [Chloroflexi bacterium]|nr:carboxymuconolactone decarboxylase family protein [Chloroflexota bacterium]MCI0789889.1 carboxymuconolactone decarboxylase family protein [Chloroflexota bacterium]MCI0811071.1 carboxymuconolactone decarboxylase family protein [Chloroflexota bacterium]MCI0828932.1 carboxymuconolactone decarboxylase family protein [Chloroflexota bacterium]MCI0897217.1 carboxymuconolactone decarboxylase family protein [Chloroflexota bacterium]